jgi:hypothetical protein
MNPPDVIVNDLESAAGSVIFLGQVLLEHSSTKVRIIPRDLLSFAPRLGNALSANNIQQFHGKPSPVGSAIP